MSRDFHLTIRRDNVISENSEPASEIRWSTTAIFFFLRKRTEPSVVRDSYVSKLVSRGK